MTIPVLSYRGKGAASIDLDVLVRSRMLIQANSGGGKSWALRQLLEETFGKVQHIVIDPEGEYHTLREQFDYVLAAKHGGDAEASPRTAKMLCRRLMETSASAVIDLYDLPIAGRREFVKIFLTELMALPKDLRRPLLVVLDEAHVFAPEGAKSDALEAVMSLASQGRKRGYALVCATQRLSKLSKDVAAEMLTRLIGRTGLDLDVKRAGDELGMDKEGRARLPMLEPGQFYAFGPALPPGPPRLVRTGEIRTSHPQPGALEAPTPAPSAKVRALLEKSFADLPQQAAEEARNIGDLQKEVTRLRGALTRAERGATEKVVEKTVTVVDQRAVDRAVKAALDPWRVYAARLLRTMNGAVESTNKTLALLHAVPEVPGEVAHTPAAATESRPVRPPAPVRVARVAPEPSGDGSVPRTQQRILDTIAWFNMMGVERPTRGNIGAVLGVSSETGSFKNYLGALRTSGHIDYPSDGLLELTEDGRAIANPASGPESLDALHDIWFDRLPGTQEKVLRIVVESYPEPISRADIAERLSVSHETGSFKNYLGALRSLGLIDYPDDGMVVATGLLFPEGL